jgi:hypothetical protein
VASKHIPASKVRVESILLCDFAKLENGKFYLLGAGWDRLSPRSLPLEQSIYIALKLVVPVEEATKPLQLSVGFVGLHEADHQATVELDLEPVETVLDSAEEVAILVPMSARVTINEPGSYSCFVRVGKKQIAQTRFVVNAPPEGEGSER